MEKGWESLKLNPIVLLISSYSATRKHRRRRKEKKLISSLQVLKYPPIADMLATEELEFWGREVDDRGIVDSVFDIGDETLDLASLVDLLTSLASNLIESVTKISCLVGPCVIPYNTSAISISISS